MIERSVNMIDLSNEIVNHVKKSDCQYLEFKELIKYNDIVKHGYCLKPYGFKLNKDNENNKYNTKIINNYKKFCQCIGIETKGLVKPNQTHTSVVKCVDIREDGISIEDEKYRDTDGLITNVKGVSLASVNADCILLILFDPVKKVIGNIHSGWKGTFKKICVNGVQAMIDNYGCNPNDIICCICPSIRKCHFQVEKDVRDLCYDIFGNLINDNDRIVEYVGKIDGVDKWVIDTVLINEILLKNMGVKSENIFDCGICSVCNSELVHSRRADGVGGERGTAVIGLI